MNDQDRLKPKNPGNARLLYIDGDLLSCDICDEKHESAIFDTIGGSSSGTLRICRECLKESLKRLEHQVESSEEHYHEFSTFQDGYYICACGEMITESDFLEYPIFY
jgi:hypothetical protein